MKKINISWKNFISQSISWHFFSCSHKFRFGRLAILRKCNDPQSRTWFTSQTLLGCWHLAGSITKPKWVYNKPYSFLLWNNWKFGWLIWMSCWFLNEFLGPPLLFKAGQGWQIGERTKKNWAKKLIGSQSQLLVKWGSSLIVKDWIFFLLMISRLHTND